VALGCGAAVAWLLAEQQPVFSNTRVLRELTGLAVLGSVRRTWVEQYQTAMRRSLYLLAGSMAGLLIAFVLVITLHEPGSRLIHKLIDL
jgi:hypothetical protein